jgi:hypothetical protein
MNIAIAMFYNVVMKKRLLIVAKFAKPFVIVFNTVFNFKLDQMISSYIEKKIFWTFILCIKENFLKKLFNIPIITCLVEALFASFSNSVFWDRPTASRLSQSDSVQKIILTVQFIFITEYLKS